MSWAETSAHDVNSLNEARPSGDSKHPQQGKKKEERKEKALIGKTSDLCSLIFAFLLKASLKGLMPLQQGSLSLPSEMPIREAGNCFPKGILFKRKVNFSSRDPTASVSQAVFPVCGWTRAFPRAESSSLQPACCEKRRQRVEEWGDVWDEGTGSRGFPP